MSMFQIGDVVQHVTTGLHYFIRGLPENIVIERSFTAAYAYSPLYNDSTGPRRLYIRPQTEMEDGRFVKASEEEKDRMTQIFLAEEKEMEAP